MPPVPPGWINCPTPLENISVSGKGDLSASASSGSVFSTLTAKVGCVGPHGRLLMETTRKNTQAETSREELACAAPFELEITEER